MSYSLTHYDFKPYPDAAVVTDDANPKYALFGGKAYYNFTIEATGGSNFTDKSFYLNPSFFNHISIPTTNPGSNLKGFFGSTDGLTPGAGSYPLTLIGGSNPDNIRNLNASFVFETTTKIKVLVEFYFIYDIEGFITGNIQDNLRKFKYNKKTAATPFNNSNPCVYNELRSCWFYFYIYETATPSTFEYFYAKPGDVQARFYNVGNANAAPDHGITQPFTLSVNASPVTGISINKDTKFSTKFNAGGVGRYLDLSGNGGSDGIIKNAGAENSLVPSINPAYSNALQLAPVGAKTQLTATGVEFDTIDDRYHFTNGIAKFIEISHYSALASSGIIAWTNQWYLEKSGGNIIFWYYRVGIPTPASVLFGAATPDADGYCHISIGYDGATTFKIFLNRVLQSNTTVLGTFIARDPAMKFCIGKEFKTLSTDPCTVGSGTFDNLRFSDFLRYGATYGDFEPYATDANTVALISFDVINGAVPEHVYARMYRSDSVDNSTDFENAVIIAEADIFNTAGTAIIDRLIKEPSEKSSLLSDTTITFTIDHTQVVSGAKYYIALLIYDETNQKYTTHISPEYSTIVSPIDPICPGLVDDGIKDVLNTYGPDLLVALQERLTAFAKFDKADFNTEINSRYGAGSYDDQLKSVIFRVSDKNTGEILLAKDLTNDVTAATVGTEVEYACEFRVRHDEAKSWEGRRLLLEWIQEFVYERALTGLLEDHTDRITLEQFLTVKCYDNSPACSLDSPGSNEYGIDSLVLSKSNSDPGDRAPQTEDPFGSMCDGEEAMAIYFYRRFMTDCKVIAYIDQRFYGAASIQEEEVFTPVNMAQLLNDTLYDVPEGFPPETGAFSWFKIDLSKLIKGLQYRVSITLKYTDPVDTSD